VPHSQGPAPAAWLTERFPLTGMGQARHFEDRDPEPDDRIFVVVGLAQLEPFGTALSDADFGGGDDTPETRPHSAPRVVAAPRTAYSRRAFAVRCKAAPRPTR